MLNSEAIDLIRGGLTGKRPQTWADLGCGSSTFTLALKELLPMGSRLTAVDKARQKLPVHFILADFENDELPLSKLNGILMANSLHYIDDKEKLIKKLEGYFLDTPAFLVVEYDTAVANRWVPYPVSFGEIRRLFTALGYESIVKLAMQPSKFGGGMYAALIKRSAGSTDV